MDDFSSLGVRSILTDNSILISSSKYLNHPLLREALATAMLRRNGRERRPGWDSTPIVRAYREIRDANHINALFAEERKKNPQLDAWLSEKFISTFRRDDLQQYAEGSLGNLFYKYLVKYNFDIDLDPNLRKDPTWRPKTDIDYFEMRAAQTHDFEHLMGGVGFDFLGEIVPFWLRIENCFRHLSTELAGEVCTVHLLLILPMICRTMLHYPKAWTVVTDSIARAVDMGRNSAPIFMARYESVLHLPLPEARKALGITAVAQMDTTELSDYWSEGALSAAVTKN
jgi:ubiquinone biosynthesis protein Coq4